MPVPSLYSRLTRFGAASSLVAWYISSTAAVLASKHVFGDAFPFPLCVTATNNLISTALAIVFARLERSPTTPTSSPTSASFLRSAKSISDSLPCLGRRPPLGFLIGLSIAAEIGLANLALQRLSVTFSTLLKGSAPLSIALWSAAFNVAPLAPQTLAASLALLGGLACASSGQVEKAPSSAAGTYLGVLLQLAAAAISGLRWTLTQSFMRRTAVTGPPSISSAASLSSLSSDARVEAEERSPAATIVATAPSTMLCLLPFIVLLEGHGIVNWLLGASREVLLSALVWVTGIGLSVFVLLYSEYYLIKAVGAMHVSVLFVAKEVCSFASVIAFLSLFTTPWLCCMN